MRIALFLTGRLLLTALTLLGVSVLVFVAMRFIPGGFEDLILGPFATEEARAIVRARFGLDQPVPVQYLRWLAAALTGDFGTSMITHQPVLDEIIRRAAVTLELALLALGLAIAAGLPLGRAAATASGWARSVARAISAFGLGVPDFVVGAVLVYIFSQFQLGLSVGGFVPFDTDWAANLRVMALPAITLGLFGIALVARTTESGVREALTQPHVTAAVSRGMPPGRIVAHHVLRNAAIPVVTAGAAYFGYLLGGTIVVEQLFSIPGLGQYVITAMGNRDYAIVQAGVLLGAAFFVLLSLLADFAYALLDPRVGSTRR
jgi:peptide/nickel transport system permease protein